MEASVLRLRAEDSEGLGILATAVQDALAKPQDLKFDKKNRAFGLEINRFQWEAAGKRPPYFRSRAVLAFTGVLAVRSQKMPRGVDDLLVLLVLQFTPADEPTGGAVRLVFANGPQVELDVECLDATLMDTGVAWPTRRKPDHEKRQ